MGITIPDGIYNIFPKEPYFSFNFFKLNLKKKLKIKKIKKLKQKQKTENKTI
jgi:hypothetical protein